MSGLSAEPSALPASPGESWPPGPKPPNEGWTRRKFLWVLGFVLGFQVALIFLCGTKKQMVPRTVGKVPHWELANNDDEFITLGDPTLFALPNRYDLVSAFWRRMPAVRQPDFRWTEAPRYLEPDAEALGAVFSEFMGTNRLPDYPQDYKPAPKLTQFPIFYDDTMPQTTTMQISDELEQRRLLHTILPPILPRNDVITPSTVQVVVSTEGNVASEVVPEPSGDAEADQLALGLARKLRFAPAPSVTVGQITFTWHTVPTNSLPANTSPTATP